MTDVDELAEAVKVGDESKVRAMLNVRPELVNKDLAENNEHRAIHFAVLKRDAAMVRLLMEAGSDARKGIYPHRDGTSAFTLAKERGYDEIVSIIEEEERLRREELSCPNANVSPVQEQINDAIACGDEEVVKRLLESDLSLIHACDRAGRTPLHHAALEGNEELVRWLIERRAKVNKRDVRELTPLDVAALEVDPRNDLAEGFPRIAGLLLEHGAELTIRGAVALGNQARVRELVAESPSLLRETSKDGGLLTLAVNHGQAEMATLLLDLGADVDERTLLHELEEPVTSYGMPLWYAALGNKYEMAKLLLDRGADPNANVYASGWPLRNAWNYEDQAVKKLLMERGAIPQPHMVAEAHDLEGARKLLEAEPTEAMASELAWSAADSGCAAIVELALAELKWPLDDGRWHWVLIQPIRGATSDRADRAGHFESMALLMKHGVNPNISRYGQTALHFAAAYRGNVSDQDRARFAAMLIDYGASLAVRDDLLKSTPLGWACRWGRKALAKLLIERGATVDESGAEEWATPRAWVEKTGNSEMRALFETK